MSTKFKWAVIDIETAPLPEAEIEQWLPDWSDWSPDMFDESAVKTGNIKDPKLKAEKIQAAKEKAEIDHIKAQNEKREEIRNKAALHPNTGWVFGLGIRSPGHGFAKLTLDQANEKDMLEMAWSYLRETAVLVNHNLLGFDLPFLAARSMRLGITLPFRIASVTPWSGQQLYLHKQVNPVTLLDTQQIAGKFAPTQKPSLNWVAKYFGLEPKTDLGGKLPWDAARENLKLAEEYTLRDAELTADIASKMQLI